MKLVLAEIRLVQVAEMRLVLAEMRLVPWVPPAFLEGGGGKNRAKGRHLTGTNMLSVFSGFNQRWGGGCSCLLLANSTSGGERGRCLLSTDSTSWVGVLFVCFRLIQPAKGGGWGWCCMSAFG